MQYRVIKRDNLDGNWFKFDEVNKKIGINATNTNAELVAFIQAHSAGNTDITLETDAATGAVTFNLWTDGVISKTIDITNQITKLVATNTKFLSETETLQFTAKDGSIIASLDLATFMRAAEISAGSGIRIFGAHEPKIDKLPLTLGTIAGSVWTAEDIIGEAVLGNYAYRFYVNGIDDSNTIVLRKNISTLEVDYGLYPFSGYHLNGVGIARTKRNEVLAGTYTVPATMLPAPHTALYGDDDTGVIGGKRFSVAISAMPNNAAIIGDDGGIYVPEPAQQVVNFDVELQDAFGERLGYVSSTATV